MEKNDVLTRMIGPKFVSALVLFTAFISFVLSFYGQSVPPVTSEDIARQRQIDAARARNDALNKRTREAEGGSPNSRRSGSVAREKAWKEAREKLDRLREVNPEDIRKYQPLLKLSNGGLFRIFPDVGCAADLMTGALSQCATYLDGSSSYSFRTGNYYNTGDFSDIRFNGDKLVTRGSIFELGILVSLGDTAVENVTLADAGLESLRDLPPPQDFEAAHDLAARLVRGIKYAGYVYTDGVAPDDNTTYALRSIAYRYPAPNFSAQAISATMAKLSEGLADNQNRADAIVVFRIVRRDKDGSVTVFWKELKRVAAPMISVPKDQKPSSFLSASDYK